ncbi:MAG: hypothetical protein WC829_05805 [Hyphomicrobium sp.]|jgi:hypothetical protein
MARQPATVGGDFVMVGSVGDDNGAIIVDDSRDDDVKSKTTGGEWDDGDGAGDDDVKGKPPREKPRKSLLGGDVEENVNGGDDDHREENDDEDEEDTRLAYEETDAGVQERGGRRSRRNRSRKAAISARDEELAELRERVARAERLQSGAVGNQVVGEIRAIEQRIVSAKAALKMGREEKARAIDEGKGADFAAIDEAAENAQRELFALEQRHAALTTQAREAFDEQGNLKALKPDVRQQQDRLKKQADRFSSIFQERYSWFDPAGASKDDRLVKRIDRELAEEGRYSPHQSEYWQEFEARMREEGFKPGDDRGDDDEREEPAERRGYRGGGARANRPPTAAARPARPGGGGGGARLTANQSDALRQLGYLENPGEPAVELSDEDKGRRDRIVAKYIAANKANR